MGDASRRPAIVLILGVVALLYLVLLATKLPARAGTHDFSVFYASAVAVQEGLDPYTADLSTISQRLGVYIGPLVHSVDTPTALFLFAPFARLSLPMAHATWLLLNAFALAAALILLLSPKYSGLDARFALAVGAIALLYAPITENFVFGQRQPLVLLLLVLVMRAMQRRQEAVAGLLLGLAIAYRAFPALIAGYFLMRREWRVLAFVGLGFVLTSALTVVGLGLGICENYPHGMFFAIRMFSSQPANVSLNGFVTRLFAHFGWGASTFSSIVQLFVISMVAWATGRNRKRENFDRASYGLWVAAAILLSPLSWIHYMMLLLIPFVEITSAAERRLCNRREVWAMVASYLLVAMTFRIRPDLVDPVWWSNGLKYLAEGPSVALLLGFLAAYWLATDPNYSSAA